MDATGFGDAGTTAPLNEVERIVDAFTAPTKTFRDILRNASWWAPFLLIVVVSLASAFVIDKQVGFDTVAQNALHDTPKIEENMAAQEPQQRAVEMHAMARNYRVGSYAAPLLVLLFAALGALGLWGTFKFVFNAEATFAQIFAVWIYAALPRLIGSLLMVVTLFFAGSAESFDIKNPVGTNLGFYLPDAAPWVRTLLNSFDIFGFWMLALLILGTSIVTGVKRERTATVVLGWWAVIVILGVAGSLLSS